MAAIVVWACACGGGPSKIVLGGTVVNNGTPVAGAVVSADGVTATTGGDGTYSMTVPLPGSRLTVSVDAQGYGPAIAVVYPKASVYHYHQDIAVPTASSLAIDAATGGSVTVMSQGRPVTITIPPNALQGSGRLIAAGYDAATGPGDLTTNDPPGQNHLQTQGMIHFEVVDAAGTPVPFVAGQGAQIGVANATLPDVAGEGPMQQYELDGSAEWGAASPTSSSASGMNLLAQEAGYWNADRAFKTACITGRVAAPTKTCGGAAAQGAGPDGIVSFDTTGADGSFCLDGAQTAGITIRVGSSQVNMNMPQAPGNCTTARGACVDIGTVNVQDSDCPQGCPAGQVDAPNGCSTPGAPSGGSCGPPAGGCASAGEVSAQLRPGCCSQPVQCTTGAYTSCADSCGNTWYELNGVMYGPCAATDPNYQTCLNNQATAVVTACQ